MQANHTGTNNHSPTGPGIRASSRSRFGLSNIRILIILIIKCSGVKENIMARLQSQVLSLKPNFSEGISRTLGLLRVLPPPLQCVSCGGGRYATNQMLFQHIFSGKLGISNHMPTDNSGKVVLLCLVRHPVMA
ncbi:hypothetical protein TNCV_3276711 [Trichonephila clavipes]|nr:hypothetical protein TNCV_3276711 [Trichonephila clavipes]